MNSRRWSMPTGKIFLFVVKYKKSPPVIIYGSGLNLSNKRKVIWYLKALMRN